MTSYTRRRRTLPDEEIVKLYVDERQDSETIAFRAGCSSSTVLAIVRAAGHEVRRPGSPPPLKPRMISDAEIIRRYRDGQAGPRIADAAGCTPATVYRILRDHDVTVRPPPSLNGGRKKTYAGRDDG